MKQKHLSRRGFLRKTVAGVAAITLVGVAGAATQDSSVIQPSSITSSTSYAMPAGIGTENLLSEILLDAGKNNYTA